MTTLLHPPVKAKRTAVAPKALSDAFEQLFSLRRIGAAEVLFVRDAEPDYDAVYAGESPLDPPLSAKGREQAMLLAAQLERSPIDAVYSSTMRRAVETAAYIGSVQGLPVARLDGLREIEFDSDAVEHMDDGGPSLAGDLARRFVAIPRWDSLPGFEPSRTFRLRVIETIESIISRHPGERVIIVCHSGVINAYLSMLLGIQRDVFFLPAHASLSTIRASGDLYAVVQLNDTAHLSSALQSS
jgi:2,3-bisphosphoglycerate-dependent phosphoglycerate mutase